MKPFKPETKLLLKKELVVEVLVEALVENDLDSFRDVLVAHLRALSKTDLARLTGLGRRTLYDLMDNKKFDPKLSTLGSLLSRIAA